MSDHKDILILAEVRDGSITPMTRELLGAGKKLSLDMGQGLSALLLGSGVGALAQDLIALGAAKVYVVDNPALASFNAESFTGAVSIACRQICPAVFLMGHTSMGRDLAPRVAARLGASLSTDCINVSTDAATKRLIQTRPAYGGNAVATVVSRAMPQMATLRSRAMPPAEADPSREGEVVKLNVDVPDSRVRITSVVRSETGQVKLEDASIVVAGGAGITDAASFEMVKELAAVVGGAVGATRLPCEEGMVPWSYQIGQTGKIVAPDLYIAVAISGAPQHMAGCSGSKCIVAVNRDAQANIFKVADYGIVADYKQALPVLTAKLREIRASC
ncbi:MAG: electron transfer flavoprotein subunit alpha/FixB family protein [Chloroflexi bacterium]|nr:electron transfer flavoprotein subunit alpha/FixB family protein [Chloroflexota bacterium]